MGGGGGAYLLSSSEKGEGAYLRGGGGLYRGFTVGLWVKNSQSGKIFGQQRNAILSFKSR